MIRIDEIYNNTFWPWLRQHRPGFREFFCEPFGRSDSDSVINYGKDYCNEHNYIFFFDQEPIHLSIHMPTFEQVVKLNNCLRCKIGELNGNEVDEYAKKKPGVYFR